MVRLTDAAFTLLSISELANRYGISKQAVSKAVKKMLIERPDTPIELGAQGRVRRVSLVHYDLHRDAHGPNIAPIAHAPTSIGSTAAVESVSFDEARRQAEWLKVGREKIRHQEEGGQLVRRDLVSQAYLLAGREIQTIILRLQNRADDIAMAVSRGGVDGARSKLCLIGEEMAAELTLCLIRASAPASPLDSRVVVSRE